MQLAARVKDAIAIGGGGSAVRPTDLSARGEVGRLGARQGLRGLQRFGGHEQLRGPAGEGFAQGEGAHAAVEQRSNPGIPLPPVSRLPLAESPTCVID